uniref:Pco079065e n=1 Tax=Arundo donax TaxID=35708 RepID=A0A0A9F0U1_ARUDO
MKALRTLPSLEHSNPWQRWMYG